MVIDFERVVNLAGLLMVIVRMICEFCVSNSCVGLWGLISTFCEFCGTVMRVIVGMIL